MIHNKKDKQIIASNEIADLLNQVKLNQST